MDKLEIFDSIVELCAAKGINKRLFSRVKRDLKKELTDFQFKEFFRPNGSINWTALEKMFRDKELLLSSEAKANIDDYEKERLTKIRLENSLLEIEKQAKLGKYIPLVEQQESLKTIARYLRTVLTQKLKFELPTKLKLTPDQVSILDDLVNELCQSFYEGKYE